MHMETTWHIHIRSTDKMHNCVVKFTCHYPPHGIPQDNVVLVLPTTVVKVELPILLAMSVICQIVIHHANYTVGPPSLLTLPRRSDKTPAFLTVKNPPRRHCALSWFFIQALPWVPRIWLGVYFKNQSKRTFVHLLDHFGAVYCILISTEGFGSSKTRGQSDNKTFRKHLNYTEIVPTLSWDALALAKFIRHFSRLNGIKM